MPDQDDRPVVPPSIARQVDDELAEHVRRRTDDLVRMIGVRVALDASPADIVKLVAGRALALSAGGLVAGLAAAMLLTRSLTSILIGVGPFDAASFGSTAALLLLVSALACLVPTRAALALDPATTLRAD